MTQGALCWIELFVVLQFDSVFNSRSAHQLAVLGLEDWTFGDNLLVWGAMNWKLEGVALKGLHWLQNKSPT